MARAGDHVPCGVHGPSPVRRRPAQLHHRIHHRPRVFVYPASYAKVFGDKDFLWSLSITFIFVVANCVLQIPLGLLIALAVHAGRDNNVHGSIVARTAVLTAWIIPGVLVGILWKTLLSSASSGIINHFVQSLGMERIPFLLDPLYAVISIIVANVWGGAAFCMILQYAGL